MPRAAVGALGDEAQAPSLRLRYMPHAASRRAPTRRARKAAHRLLRRAVAPPPAAPAAAPLAASAPLDGDGLGATALQGLFDPT